MLKKLGIGCGAFFGLFVVLAIVASLAGGGSDGNGDREQIAAAAPSAVSKATTTSPAGPPPTATPVPPTPTPATSGTKENPFPPNTDVRVGEVRWKIHKAEIREELPGLFDQVVRARGKYVVVVAEVENLGSEMKTVTDLHLVDAMGRRFSSSSDTFDLPEDAYPEQLFILENLNPNVPYQFTGVFEVPADATGLLAEISDLRLFGPTRGYVSLGVE